MWHRIARAVVISNPVQSWTCQVPRRVGPMVVSAARLPIFESFDSHRARSSARSSRASAFAKPANPLQRGSSRPRTRVVDLARTEPGGVHLKVKCNTLLKPKIVFQFSQRRFIFFGKIKLKIAFDRRIVAQRCSVLTKPRCACIYNHTHLCDRGEFSKIIY